MNKILNNNGEYLIPKFLQGTEEWFLVGTESKGKLAVSCIDTFRNVKTGEFREMMRKEVFEMAEQELISVDKIKERKVNNLQNSLFL